MTTSISTSKAESISNAIVGLKIDNKEIKSIFFKAFSGTASRMRAVVAKEVHESTGIPKKAVRRRVFFKRKKGKSSTDFRVWIGINDIEYAYLGNPKQSGDDVIVATKDMGAIKIKNAYIQTEGRLRKYTGEEAKYKIPKDVIEHINSVIPYYFEKEFYRAFEAMLKIRFK